MKKNSNPICRRCKYIYDERTRQLDHHWATYAYAREEGIEYGIQQGIQRGMQQGKIGAIVSLVKEGIIAEVGAKKLNITEQEFEAYL